MRRSASSHSVCGCGRSSWARTSARRPLSTT
ncbi:Uncharacterised protein [Bordetella pertussis]|nr:Uncharacterised protein [Bordetella pertussis]